MKLAGSLISIQGISLLHCLSLQTVSSFKNTKKMGNSHNLLGLLALYLEAKGLSSEVAALVVDETKLQLEGTSPVHRHSDLQVEKHES